MKNTNTSLFERLFNQALSNPTNLTLWGMLAEIAPRQSQCILKKYLYYLQTGKVSRQRYGTANSTLNNKTLNITFFTPSPCKRLLRHTLCARAAGMKVQLIVEDTSWQSHPIQEELYDHILHIDNIFLEIDCVIKALNSFNSSLIHMITCASTNYHLIPLALISPLPVIGDPYDLCHGQFTDWPGYSSEFQKNLHYEKVWMQHLDGICMRAHYLKMPSVRTLLPSGIPFLHIIDAVRSRYFVRNVETIDSNKLNILMDGTSSSNEVLAAEIYQMLDTVSLFKNVTIHMCRDEGIDYSKYGSTVKTYPNLPVARFEELLRTMDAFMMPSSIDYYKHWCYTPEMQTYTSRSTLSDVLESDIVMIVPSGFAQNARIATQANRGIIFTPEEQTSLQFWKTLPQRVAALRQQEPTPQKFLDTTLGPHLDSFYRRVIRRTASRH